VFDSPVSGFGGSSSMESLERVLADTNKNVGEYIAWCTIEFPALMKQAIESGLTAKGPPQVSIFERGYPLLERLAKKIDGWLSFDPSQKELLSQLTDHLEDPVYVEETERGLSFLHVPFRREYPVAFSKGRTIRGRIDLRIYDLYEEMKIGIEIDYLTIKLESALKLASPYLDYRVFVLTGKVGIKEMAESLFTLTKFCPTNGWQNTLVMAKNRGFYLGYLESPSTTVVKGQIVMPLEAQ
jgi:hypothetical protein